MFHLFMRICLPTFMLTCMNFYVKSRIIYAYKFLQTCLCFHAHVVACKHIPPMYMTLRGDLTEELDPGGRGGGGKGGRGGGQRPTA